MSCSYTLPPMFHLYSNSNECPRYNGLLTSIVSILFLLCFCCGSESTASSNPDSSAAQSKSKTLFRLVSPSESGIHFSNQLNETNDINYYQWDYLILDDRKRKQILIPPGVGNGFLVLSEKSVFHYKWCYSGKYPDVQDQFTIKWNDPIVGVDWPIDNPILSRRDK